MVGGAAVGRLKSKVDEVRRDAGMQHLLVYDIPTASACVVLEIIEVPEGEVDSLAGGGGFDVAENIRALPSGHTRCPQLCHKNDSPNRHSKLRS